MKPEDVQKWLTKKEWEAWEQMGLSAIELGQAGLPKSESWLMALRKCYEALAERNRLIYDANKAHDENWVDSWFTKNKSKIAACLEGVPNE